MNKNDFKFPEIKVVLPKVDRTDKTPSLTVVGISKMVQWLQSAESLSDVDEVMQRENMTVMGASSIHFATEGIGNPETVRWIDTTQ